MNFCTATGSLSNKIDYNYQNAILFIVAGLVLRERKVFKVAAYLIIISTK